MNNNNNKTFIEEAATTGAIIAIFFTLAGLLAILVRLACYGIVGLKMFLN
jgi:hypothetical protein